MKKFIIMGIIVIAGFAFLFNEICSKSEIGFIDTVRILQESTPGKKGIARLEELQANAVKQLEELEKKRSDAEQKKEKELVERISAEMQAIAYELQNKLQAEQEAVFAIITAELTTIVEEFRKDNKLTVIFNHNDVISFNPKSDITTPIMEEFNKLEIDFTLTTAPQ